MTFAPTSIAAGIDKMIQLYGAQQYDAALSLGLELLKREKKNPTLYNMVGVLQFQATAHDAAVISFRRAIKLVPNFADAHYNLGNLYRAIGRHDAAETAFREAINSKPAMIKAHQNLANLLAEIGRSTEAILHYKTVITAHPTNIDVLNNYALALETGGQLAEARAIYEQLLSIAPNFAVAHRNYSLVKTYETGDPHIDVMEKLLASDGLPVDDQINLHFALGKAYDQIKNVDRAFANLQKGNALRHAQLADHYAADRRVTPAVLRLFANHAPPAPIEDASAIATGKATMPGKATRTRKATRTTNAAITFIVGMPRSGTSLVEQILASHSHVLGAGERGELESICHPIAQQTANDDSAHLHPTMLKSVARDYRQGLPTRTNAQTHITDKLPTNYRYLGFALAAMPEARAIWVRRDPLATCWSIYRSYFATNGLSWTYAFDSIAAEFADQLAVMNRWMALFPGLIHVVDYDQLTQNPEPAMRAMVNFQGLEWEAACLDFHKTERDVRTLSAGQVREKLYTGSSERWRAYEHHLAPLVSALQHHNAIA